MLFTLLHYAAFTSVVTGVQDKMKDEYERKLTTLKVNPHSVKTILQSLAFSNHYAMHSVTQ